MTIMVVILTAVRVMGICHFINKTALSTALGLPMAASIKTFGARIPFLWGFSVTIPLSDDFL
jgi:Na+-translocating ferredoxin:NAD+ oxidoreductase RnfA subunit